MIERDFYGNVIYFSLKVQKTLQNPAGVLKYFNGLSYFILISGYLSNLKATALVHCLHL